MRISGLVSACTRVQAQLENGIRPEAAEQFREYVRTIVRTVESLCSDVGVSPNDLPARSRNAYFFLKHLDLEHLPLNGNIKKAPAVKRAHVKNVVGTANRFSLELWETLDELIESPSALADLRFGIEVMASAIEDVCKEQGATVYGMQEPSLQSYAWLKFLLIDGILGAHVEALRVGRYTALEQGLSVEIHLVNSPKSLYKSRNEGDRLVVKVHEGFIHATPDVWSSLLKAINSGSAISRSAVVEFGKSKEFIGTFQKLISMMCPCNERHRE